MILGGSRVAREPLFYLSLFAFIFLCGIIVLEKSSQ